VIRLFLPASASDQFLRAASRWQNAFKKDVSVILRQQCRSLVTNSQRTGVADLTPPTVGTSAVGSVSEQRKAGEVAVARDIGRVFISARAAVANAKEEDAKAGKILSRLLRERKTEQALNLLRSGGGEQKINIRSHNRKGGVIVAAYTQRRQSPAFRSLSRITEIQDEPDPGLHRRSRDSRGRVNRFRPTMIVRDSGALTSYIRQKQALVGFHKSGWKRSAAAVGAALPAFVSRLNGPGRVIDNLQQAGTKFGVTFINDTPGILRHNAALSIAARALQFAAGRIDRAVRGYLQRTQKI
jgi:hypothetical protein